MLSKLATGLLLMALCVAIHASGVTVALRRLRTRRITSHGRMDLSIWLLVQLAGWMVMCHLIEICVWGFYYDMSGALADLDTSLYFSGITYTTTGYGDVVLPRQWTLVGAVEALTGILMCGWSTGFFFAVVNRLQHELTEHS